jgi:DNA-nicking Smr family endonuclease
MVVSVVSTLVHRKCPGWYCTDLRQVLKRGNRRNVVKKSKHQFLDEDLFRREMADVVPLKAPQTTDSKMPLTSTRQRRRESAVEDFTWPGLSSTDNTTHIEDEDGSSHRKNGVQIRTMQRLKRGRFPVGRQLDLHNLTVDAGHRVLLEFIADAQDKMLECVRVIHGKGLRSENGPRLRLMTRQVLRDHPRVLAFTPCKQADGGTGAMDVLLKTS